MNNNNLPCHVENVLRKYNLMDKWQDMSIEDLLHMKKLGGLRNLGIKSIKKMNPKLYKKWEKENFKKKIKKYVKLIKKLSKEESLL